MKSILLALFLRPLVRRPWRFLLTVIGVAVGVASVIATVAANQAAIASFEEGVTEIAGATRLEITRPGGVDEALLGQLRPLCRDAFVLPVIEEVALVPALEDSVRVLGVDAFIDSEAREIGGFAIGLAGPAGDSAEPSGSVFDRVFSGNDVLVPRSLAEVLGVETGGEVEISARGRPVSLSVAGVFEPRLLGAAWDRLLVIDIATAQELFGRLGQLDRIELVPRPGVPVEDLEERAKASVPSTYDVAPPSRRGQQTTKAVRALRFNLTALSGISLLVGAVLVATTLATAIVQRRAVIAQFRSLGASKAQIVGVVFLEALSVGVLGGVIGVVFGAAGARAALKSVRATVAVVVPGAPATGIEVSFVLALLGIAAGVGVGLVAAILPALEVVSTPPVQGLRKDRPVRISSRSLIRTGLVASAFAVAAVCFIQLPSFGDLPVAALGGALCLLLAQLVLSSPGLDLLARGGSCLLAAVGLPVARLSSSALAASHQRAAWAAGAVAVAVALSVSIATMVHSFRVTVVDWTEQSLKSDLWIRPRTAATGVSVGRLDPILIDVARDLFGEDAVDPFHREQARFRGREITLSGGAFEVVAPRAGIPYLSGRSATEVLNEAFASHSAVVNESFANRFGVEAGDTIELEVPEGIVEKVVIDVFYDYSDDRGQVIIDRADFLAIYPDRGPHDISIFLPPSADPREEKARFLHALGGRFEIDVLPNRELKREVLGVFERTFAITTALQMVSSIVAVIAVFTVLSALVFERRRQLGVLRAVGASRRQVLWVVLGEAGQLGLFGAGSGLVFGLLVGRILVTTVNLQSFGWTLRYMPPIGDISIAIGGVLAACLVAGYVPARAASRFSPAEVLRSE